MLSPSLPWEVDNLWGFYTAIASTIEMTSGLEQTFSIMSQALYCPLDVLRSEMWLLETSQELKELRDSIGDMLKTPLDFLAHTGIRLHRDM